MSSLPATPPGPRPRLHIHPTPAATAQACADEIVRRVRRTAAPACPPASVAFSGGTTPAAMFRALAQSITDDPETAAGWARTHIFQVDERLAPEGDPQRNANDLVNLLLDPTGVDPGHRHLIDVTRTNEAALYARTLELVAPAGLDVVVLGLGDDGHTASLVPGDPVVDITDEPVALTGAYRGSRRLTLTRATLDRARAVLWLVTGPAKAEPLSRLMDGDRTIPAGLIGAEEQIVFADHDAAALVTHRSKIMTPSPAPVRRAVYPGSFDPPTIAHLAIAVATLEQCRCASLTFVLSRAALGKEDRSDTVEARALLLRTLVDDHRFRVEVTSTSFIAEIAQGYDVVVVGADKWAQVLDPIWYPDETTRDAAVASLPHVALVPRPPHASLVKPSDAMTVLELGDPILAQVSSTAVRSGRTDWAARPPRSQAEEELGAG